jgi:hypothetical protein
MMLVDANTGKESGMKQPESDLLVLLYHGAVGVGVCHLSRRA